MSDPAPRLTLSSHAQVVIDARGIELPWIIDAIDQPALSHPDADDPTLTHALRPVPQRDSRVLRVVYNHTQDPPHVVTAYFDRAMRGKL